MERTCSHKRILLRTLIAVCSLFPILAFGIGGLFDYGFSTISQGMGGAGAALPSDSISASVNPAAMAFVGHRADVGLGMIVPNTYYTADPAPGGPAVSLIIAPGDHRMTMDIFMVPNAGINWNIDPKDTFGISFYSPAGFGSSYANIGNAIAQGVSVPGPAGDGRLTSDLKIATASFTLAHKLTPDTSFGASFLVLIQSFQSRGANGFSAITVDGAGSNLARGTDYNYGVGVRLGFLTRLVSWLDFAASYQPVVRMTQMRLYTNLFPDRGQLDIPANGILGIAIHFTDKLVLAFDVQHIWYGTVKQYTNGNSGVVTAACATGQTQRCFGGSDGPGFGWRDQTDEKIGLEWQATPKWTFRLGWDHSNEVVRTTQLAANIIAPGAVLQDDFTAGASYKANRRNQLNFAFGYVPTRTLTGLNELSAGTQKFTIRAGGVNFALGWTYLFDA